MTHKFTKAGRDNAVEYEEYISKSTYIITLKRGFCGEKNIEHFLDDVTTSHKISRITH